MNEESRPKAAPETGARSDQILPSTDLQLVDTISYAFTEGYDLGVRHGRAAERALIATERVGARAGEIVSALADVPLSDPLLAAARQRERQRRGWVA